MFHQAEFFHKLMLPCPPHPIRFTVIRTCTPRFVCFWVFNKREIIRHSETNDNLHCVSELSWLGALPQKTYSWWRRNLAWCRPGHAIFSEKCEKLIFTFESVIPVILGTVGKSFMKLGTILALSSNKPGQTKTPSSKLAIRTSPAEFPASPQACFEMLAEVTSAQSICVFSESVKRT